MPPRSCAHAAGNLGALCRAARDTCDFPEVCDGVTSICPTDTYQPNGTACSDGSAPGYYVTISATSTYTSVMPYSILGTSTTLSSQAVVRIQ